MFDFLKRGKKPVAAGPEPDKMVKYCAERRWKYFGDRAEIGDDKETQHWIPPEVRFVVADPGGEPVCRVYQDRGTEFIVANELGRYFCVCQARMSQGGNDSITVYIARNWQKLPNLSLVAVPAGRKTKVPNALPAESRLAKSYFLDTASPDASLGVFRKPVQEALSSGTAWNILVRDEWVSCHRMSRVPVGSLDAFVNAGTTLMMAFSQGG